MSEVMSERGERTKIAEESSADTPPKRSERFPGTRVDPMKRLDELSKVRETRALLAKGFDGAIGKDHLVHSNRSRQDAEL